MAVGRDQISAGLDSGKFSRAKARISYLSHPLTTRGGRTAALAARRMLEVCLHPCLHPLHTHLPMRIYIMRVE